MTAIADEPMVGREGGVRGVEHYLEYKTVILDQNKAA